MKIIDPETINFKKSEIVLVQDCLYEREPSIVGFKYVLKNGIEDSKDLILDQDKFKIKFLLNNYGFKGKDVTKEFDYKISSVDFDYEFKGQCLFFNPIYWTNFPQNIKDLEVKIHAFYDGQEIGNGFLFKLNTFPLKIAEYDEIDFENAKLSILEKNFFIRPKSVVGIELNLKPNVKEIENKHIILYPVAFKGKFTLNNHKFNGKDVTKEFNCLVKKPNKKKFKGYYFLFKDKDTNNLPLNIKDLEIKLDISYRNYKVGNGITFIYDVAKYPIAAEDEIDFEHAQVELYQYNHEPYNFRNAYFITLDTKNHEKKTYKIRL